MAESSRKIVPVSENLYKIGDIGLYQPPSSVAVHFSLSDQIVERVFDEGKDRPFNFFGIAGKVLRKAVDQASDESTDPVCRKGGDCRACLGSSYENRKSVYRPQTEEFPNLDMSLHVSCESAMVSLSDPNMMGTTAVELRSEERRVGAEG